MAAGQAKPLYYPYPPTRSVFRPCSVQRHPIDCADVKVLERMLVPNFGPRLERIGAFGASQFASSQGRVARDVVLYATLRWPSAFASWRRLALCCSDVAGAFDRVDAQRLLEKLCGFGCEVRLCVVISSWLEARSVRAVVQWARPRVFLMIGMIYQGTVWGPVLWNVFFSSPAACVGIRSEQFEEICLLTILTHSKNQKQPRTTLLRSSARALSSVPRTVGEMRTASLSTHRRRARRSSTCSRGGRAHVARMVLFVRDCASGKRANVVE